MGLLFGGVNCSKAPSEKAKPVILKTGSARVTIAWTSRKPYHGSVFYKAADSSGALDEAAEAPGESTRHQVTISGLLPGVRYTYQIGKNGEVFYFRTQPEANKPFSFMMAYGEVSGKARQLLENEVFDFLVILNTGEASARYAEQFAGMRTSVPLFDLSGPAACGGENNRQPPKPAWNLDWGGLRLIFVENLEELPGLLASPAFHTFGIVVSPGLIESFKEEQKVDEESLRTGKLHAVLTEHNRAHPTALAAFVLVPGTKDDGAEVDGIRYAGIPTAPGSGTIRVDVDVENIRAVFAGLEKEIVLRMPPLQGKRTCLECRRLADKGAYEESIAAYKDFIANNRGHYQIDDAYFAIAEIYDEKLFLFKEAEAWYSRLINEYPSGSLTALAKQRLKHLARFGGESYEALQRFESIRKVEYARQKGKKEEQSALLEDIASIIRANPDIELAPLMQHWLASRLREFTVEEAVAAYKHLKEKYPGSAEAKEVSIEIGTVYYNAGFYKEALQAYGQALQEVPDKAKTIASLTNRVKRSMRRDRLAIFFWVLFAVLVSVVLALKPRGLDLSRIGRYIVIFVILTILFSFAVYLIHEQFVSTQQWLLFVMFFALNAALSSLLSTNFAAKVFKPGANRFLKFLSGSLIGILLFTAGFYLTIYYVNVHFLVLFKL